MNIPIQLPALNGGPFNSRPAETVTLSPEKVHCNNVIFPHEFNPHNVRLFVIGHAFGPLCAVWASHEGDALDEAADLNLMDAFQVAEEDARDPDNPDEDAEGIARAGNASEPFDLSDAWIRPATVDPLTTPWLALAFAEARGANADTLDDYPPHTPKA